MIQVSSAPGKLVIFGEYSVLEGYPGMVAAVNRRAKCSKFVSDKIVFHSAHQPDDYLEVDSYGNALGVVPSSLSIVPFVLKVVLENGAALKPGKYVLDSNELYLSQQGQKLGLGSSAAITVCLTAQLLGSLDVFTKSLAAHRNFSSGSGSGIDVAASCFGGWSIFQYSTSAEPTVSPIQVKFDGFELVPVFCGQAQNTRNFLTNVAIFKQNKPLMYKQIIQELGACHKELISNFSVSMLKANVEILTLLGTQAHIPIVSESHQKIIHIAEQFGGTAKPSGAGGGDISLCYVPTDAREKMLTCLSDNGCSPLDLVLGAPGVGIDEGVTHAI